MAGTQNTGPAPAGAAQPPKQSGASVCVDTALIVLASRVLDHGRPAALSIVGTRGCGDLPNRLREAAGADGHRTHPPATRPGHAAGRPERDELATTIERLLRPEHRGLLRQLDAALVHETVQNLRRENMRWTGEPLGTATRRLWEHLYLSIPLTAIVATDSARP
ncbi:hypothetical protein ACFWOG_25985 [Kitasatospora sp. NPDC058406]|uniref:hypothetical protein n=1 Tax=Kitasatospora sp. NPDC058406 TaxID=3346483 RepID=UPI003648D13C